MVSVRGGHYDLRAQNGTLYFFMRNKLIQQQAQVPTVSVFISAGPDFKLNWLKTPPMVFDPMIEFNCTRGNKKEFGFTEPHRDQGDWSEIVRTPNNAGFKEIADQGEMGYCDGEVQAVTQGLSDVVKQITSPFTLMFNLNNAAISFPERLDEFQNTVSEAKEAIKKASNAHEALMDTATKHIELAASTILAGNVIRGFSKVCREPTAGNFVDLSLGVASLLGFNVRKHILKTINSLIDHFSSKEREQARAQAIDGQYRDWETDRKSTRLNSSHSAKSRMPSSA